MIIRHAYIAKLGEGDQFQINYEYKAYLIKTIWFEPTSSENFYYGYELDADGNQLPIYPPTVIPHSGEHPVVVYPAPTTTTPIETIVDMVDWLNNQPPPETEVNEELENTTDTTGIEVEPPAPSPPPPVISPVPIPPPPPPPPTGGLGL